MAKIPESELMRLKREVSLVRLICARGIALTGQGDNLLGLCPFHDDREPSLVVSPAKNVWHCLGACKTGGSVIDWVMKAERVSFRHAAELLRKEASSLVAEKPVPRTHGKLEVLSEPEAPDAEVLQRVVAYYHRTLLESPEALGYLASRGLEHPELAAHFSLGYANRTLGYRIPQKQVKKGEVLRAQLVGLGLYRASGHEHLAGSLTIPVFSERGEVMELYGRKIRSDLRPGTPKHLYLPRRPDSGRGVFNRAGLESAKDVILCESLIDALTFWCAGFRNVTASYGTEGFSEEHVLAFENAGIERVLIAYDRDEAGDKAAEALAPRLAERGFSVHRVLFPKGMDANAYALKVKPAGKALLTALLAAQWMAGTVKTRAPKPAVPESPAPEPLQPAAEPVQPPVPVPVEPQVEAPAPAPPPTPAPATSLVASSGPEVIIERRKEEVIFQIGDRRYRVRGLERNTSYDALRINLLVSRDGRFFVDTLDLYVARHRQAFVKQAAAELAASEDVIGSDLGRVLVALEDFVHEQVTKTLEVQPAVTMSEAEHQEALEYLRAPKLVERILSDFAVAGVVGEETNKLACYLAAVSRKLARPLAVVLQSSSAAGKSSLMDAVLRFIPPEERVQYSAMTGQSLFYMGEQDLAHKVLAIAEEEGAHSASYALKLLQSEGRLTIASTGKDPVSGRHVTHAYEVKGPVAIFLTTTALEVDEELLNRCLVLTVDEGSEQTALIHAAQREAETLEGLLAHRQRDRVVARHQNVQRLIEPLHVVNPHAGALRFSSHTTRARRDHAKYLALIRSVALLHQHQRNVHEVSDNGEQLRYVEVLASDIALADELAQKVLAPSQDELPPQTEKLLGLIESFVKAEAQRQAIAPKDVRFSRRDLRAATRFGHSALKKHLQRLEELEHLLVHAGSARKRVVYGLAERSDYDANWSPPKSIWTPEKPAWTPPGHGLVTPEGCPDSSSDSEPVPELVTVSANGVKRSRDEAPVVPYPKVVHAGAPKNGAGVARAARDARSARGARGAGGAS